MDPGVLIAPLPTFQINIVFKTQKERNNASNILLIELLSSFLESYVLNELNSPSASIEEQILLPIFLRYNSYQSSRTFVDCEDTNPLCWSVSLSTEAEFIHTPSLSRAREEYVALLHYYNVHALQETSVVSNKGDTRPNRFTQFLRESYDWELNITDFEVLFTEQPYYPFRVGKTNGLTQDLSFEAYQEKTFGKVLSNSPVSIIFFTTLMSLMMGTYMIAGHAWSIYKEKRSAVGT